MTHPIRYIAQFIGLILLQVLIIDKIPLGTLSTFITPYIYIVFIMTLPIPISHWGIMFLAFLMGTVVDVFEDTLGMHASAMVLIGFLRPYLLKLLAPREGYDTTKLPSVYSMERNRFIVYVLILSFIFHLWFFVVEILRFSSFHITFIKSLLSAVTATALITLMQYLTIKK